MNEANAEGERRPGQGVRALAVIRIAAVPVVLIGERLVDHPTPASGPFNYFLAAALVYAVLAFVASFSERQIVPRGAYLVLDLAFICALTYTSGGAFSQLRYAFFLIPIGAAFIFPPRVTATSSAVAVLAYLAVSLPHPATHGKPELEFVLTQAVYLVWAGIAATALSRVLELREQRISELAASRGRLVAQALDAEDRERRRLAEALHDEAIQNLLAARQDLEQARHADDPELVRARKGVERTLEQLRGEVLELHTYALEHAGLAAALQAVADQQGRRSGYRANISVEPEANGIHDQLLYSLARELLINAAKHARASEVWITVERGDGVIVLEVSDNGVGIDPDRAQQALNEGHIGLASSAERVEAIGGDFAVAARDGGGTAVTATLPAAVSDRTEGRV